jgi:hypothetical protein
VHKTPAVSEQRNLIDGDIVERLELLGAVVRGLGDAMALWPIFELGKSSKCTIFWIRII